MELNQDSFPGDLEYKDIFTCLKFSLAELVLSQGVYGAVKVTDRA